MKVIVSDTTSLIALDKLESLGLLGTIFDSVLLPFAVLSELEVGSPQIRENLEAAGCFEFIRLEDSEQLSSLKIMLDLGEAEAITLALERKLPILIDERKGRSIAKQLNLTVTGFAGVLILAVKKNALKPATAREMLDQAIINGFRLSDALYKRVSEILEVSFREQKQSALQERVQHSLDEPNPSIPAADAFANIRKRSLGE